MWLGIHSWLRITAVPYSAFTSCSDIILRTLLLNCQTNLVSIILVENVIISMADRGVKLKLRRFDVYYDIYIFPNETETVCCYKKILLLNMKTMNDVS